MTEASTIETVAQKLMNIAALDDLQIQALVIMPLTAKPYKYTQNNKEALDEQTHQDY